MAVRASTTLRGAVNTLTAQPTADRSWWWPAFADLIQVGAKPVRRFGYCLAAGLSMLCLISRSGPQEYPVKPYIDPSQLDVPFGKHSFLKQPWRAYQVTKSGYDFLQGIGINFNGPANQDEAMRLLAETGFHAARIEIGWGDVNWDETGFKNEARRHHVLELCRQYKIRPMILLNANQGNPCPTRSVKYTLAADAPQGSMSVRLTETSGIVVGRSGLDNLKGFYTAQALITSVDPQSGECRLSRPLPKALTTGEPISISTLKYLPLYPIGTPQFEETSAGWVRYALLVCHLLRDAGVHDFDLEIWNEMTFGSDFSNINNYYHPRLNEMPPDILRKGGSAWEMAARTAAAVKKEYPQARLIWGFSNTTFFHTPIENLPPGIDGQSYHPYQTGKGKVSAERPHGTMESNVDGYLPTFSLCRPEGGASTLMQTECLMRLINPQSRERHPPGVTRFYHDMTEHGVLPITCGIKEDQACWDLKTKAVLRVFCFWLNKGLDTLDWYSAYGRSPQDWGLLPPDMTKIATGSDFASIATPPMRALQHLTQAFAGSEPLVSTRPLEFEVAALGEQHPVFTGDATHPSLWTRDEFAALPFQVTPDRFIIAIYTKTDDVTTPLGEERYRLAISGLPSGMPHIKYYDPIQNVELPTRQIDVGGGTIRLELPSTDYPRLLMIDTNIKGQ